MFRDYAKLLRIKHYVKNTIVFLPLFFGKAIFDVGRLKMAFVAFVCMCLVSSAVYICNDLRDVDKDRNHPLKKNRPIASGRVKPGSAIAAFLVCFIVAVVLATAFLNMSSMICLAAYLGVNVAYSLGLKNIPLIDVAILASGFVLRIMLGGFAADIAISGWLYLVVASGSLYMGLGKRRNELKYQSGTRDVLARYSMPFLDKNMYVCVALTDVFYALWTLEMNNTLMIYSVPVFIIILMRYSLDVEGNSDGDPVEVILSDKVLMALIVLYAVVISALIYLHN